MFPRTILIAIVLLTPAGWLHSLAQETTDQARDTASSGVGSTADGESVHTDSTHQNRLAEESSPYLLQHAQNPVDWYPWGEEAFAKAKREDKMIFLSVGYAACHWCHVMERESFTDPEIAAQLNEKFVCIKVDREERPDVDQIYMTAVQMVSGNGGWPMSVFLLPDARPFWGGTYFPARDGDRGAATGFLTVIDQIDSAWSEQRERVTQQADALTQAVRANQQTDAAAVGERPFNSALVDSVVESLSDQYDPKHGGFGPPEQGPKFPEPSNLIFILDRWQRESVNPAQRDSAKRMLLKSLDGMISGGMYDHLGGGFHRYSVDQQWQIPHFEKMLYDNAQLISIYAEAYERTGIQEYRSIVEATCDFVLRELTDSTGAFYSSLDADSDGEEGKFYRWTEDELATFNDLENFSDFALAYRLDGEPNFEGKFFVPAPGTTLTAIAEENSEPLETLLERFSTIRAAMLAQREARSRPMTDDKILTGWNGLMIQALADAGRILDRKDYTSAAVKATKFLMKHCRTVDGRLRRSHARGEAKFNAYLDDYAFLTAGIIALHRAIGEPRLLEMAAEITDTQIEWFWDDQAGGFYFTSKDHPELIVRVKDPVDSAVPAGISVSAANLLYLLENGIDRGYERRLRATLQSITPLLRRAPGAAPRAATVMAKLLDSPHPSSPPDAGGQP